ncbi:MAG TPA: FtsX-like permease family protein [Candidatus Methanoperedens sp.]|nr:FtsX-like permease family protein [Candidatus Methanoperedens sp.]
MKITTLARRNLRRKSARTWLLLAIVAVVSCTLFSATLFLKSINNALRLGTYRLGADILVVPHDAETVAREALLSGHPTQFVMDRAVLDRVRAVPGVKAVTPQVFIQPTSFTCCFNVDVFLVGFDPETDFTVRPWLKKHLGRSLGINEVITGREIPVVAGNEIPFFGTGFRVAGTMEPTGMDFFDRAAFMSMESAYRMAENSRGAAVRPLELGRDKISAVLVQIADDMTPDRVAIRIEHDVDGVKAIASDTVISTVRSQLSGLIRAILVISVILWGIVLLIMAFAFSMIVNERRREIGLLRAMGAARGQITQVILTEAALLAAAGAAAGVALGFGILLSFKDLMLHHLRLPYLFPSPADLALLTGGAVAIALLTGLLSALLPAWSAVRTEPYDATRSWE